MGPSTEKEKSQISVEAEWAKRIRAGDELAFEKLFRTYCQPLINFSRRYVLDPDIAENLVQDVFLKVWQNRSSLNPALSIKTYLYTGVKNQSLRHLKHQEVKRRSEVHVSQTYPEVKTPDDEWNEKEVAESIRQAIAELPEKCRMVFMMNRFDRMTYNEIAEVQNISVKTVETQMSRALKFLRKQLVHLVTIFPI